MRLDNVRAFAELELDFSTPDGSCRKRTLVIGKNGTCKSTLLRSIVLAVAKYQEGASLVGHPIGGLVGPKGDSARVTAAMAAEDGGELIEGYAALRKDTRREALAGEKGWRDFFVVAYGAGRFLSGVDPSSDAEYKLPDAVSSLFNGARPLSQPELTLRRLNDFLGTKFYASTLTKIKAVLNLGAEDEIQFRRGGGIEISGPTLGRSISLDAWADGYRVTFTWLLDFYSWAMRAGAIDEEGVVRGLLLIDEVDQHLHPSMQAQVMPRLAELLPEVQIIATTHSPLVALGCAPEELVALHRMPDGQVVVAPTPDFRLYSAEDMLTDDRLFDTSPYSEEVTAKVGQYEELAAKPAAERSAGEASQLRDLARELVTPALAADAEPLAASLVDELKADLERRGLKL